MLAQLVTGNVDAQDIFWALAVIVFMLVAIYHFMHNAPIEGAKMIAFIFLTVGLMFLS